MSHVPTSRKALDKPIKITRKSSANSQIRPDRNNSVTDLKINQDFYSLVQLYGGSRQDQVINELVRINNPPGMAILPTKEPLPHQNPERRAKLALQQAEQYQEKIITRVQYLQNEERKLYSKINQTRSK
jgi:hypothetical protein